MNELKIKSEMFADVCFELSRLNVDREAQVAFDGLSGAYGFTDEVPRTTSSEVLFACYSVLRALWAYRQSIVLGKPRCDLQEWWNSTLRLAPNWPGFLIGRRSNKMQSIAIEYETKARSLSRDLDLLSERMKKAVE